MQTFFETRFGPTELEIIDIVLKRWLISAGVAKGTKDAEIAAAVAISLFREGNTTIPALSAAMNRHQGLAGLLASAAGGFSTANKGSLQSA